MSSLIVTIRTTKDPSEYKRAGQKNQNTNRIVDLINGLKVGSLVGEMYVQSSSSDPVSAIATVVLTHASIVNNDTTTLLNVVITAATSGNGTTSWTIGANATADAVAMAACINANTTLNKQILATAATGTVTLTALQKGVLGNGLALATSNGTGFALTGFAGGTGGATDAAEQVR